jgi:mono/diheme cytochrome c family protein
MAPMSCLSLLIWAVIGFSISLPEAIAATFLLPVHFEGALDQKTKDSSLALQKLRVMDPYEKTEIEFEGYSLTDVMDRVYGDQWQKLGTTHQLRMKCLDGYQLSVPLSRILEHRALLAIRRTAQPEFKILKKDVAPEKLTDLSPGYLVWENIKDLAIRAEGDYGWPFQWTEAKIEVLGAGDSIPLPNKGASPAAFRGFSNFKVHCLKCHSLGGVGGKVGPELHSPRNVTRYWRAELLPEWLLNPASFRIPNGMPPLAPDHPDRALIAREVVEYLKSISSPISLERKPK